MYVFGASSKGGCQRLVARGAGDGGQIVKALLDPFDLRPAGRQVLLQLYYLQVG